MKPELLRALPKMDLLLARPALAGSPLPYALRRQAARQVLDEYRAALRAGALSAVPGLDELEQSVLRRGAELARPALGRVINATGVVLHTNLGRAPLSPRAAAAVGEAARGYSNLEYDLSARRRGRRGAAVESLLCALTGAEAALVVNNNAAAVFLLLSALAAGRGVALSRGELVEIGGKFRVPDVMAQSGAIMVDLGTTNKTHLSDYEEAINENTAALLKVHTSNFRVVGFTESVSVAELVELGNKHGLPVIEDIGSGVLIDLSKYGLTYEPTVQESIRAGAAIVCFSGDKLLGGPQAGIIVGRKEYIKKIKKHPLTRAFRIDKFTAAALELTLQEYLSEENAIRNIPVLRMLTQPPMEIRERAEKLAAMLKNVNARVEVVDCESQVGGGSMPLERLRSSAVAIKPNGMTTAAFEEALRRAERPVICRVQEDRALMDMRTVQPGETELIAAEVAGILGVK